MPSGFNYSKWDNIELSDDEEDFHPNIDKDSWVRLKHRTHVERDEDEGKKEAELRKKLARLNEDLKAFGEAGQEHLKAQKIRQEIGKIEGELEEMLQKRKWNADNMCKTSESQTVVSESRAVEPTAEPRLSGEAVSDGYCEFVEEHEALLEEYIALGTAELEEVEAFLKRHGGLLLQGEHAESYLLLDCLEKEMNDEHEAMLCSARQQQLLTQLREFSRAAGRPARDGVAVVFQRLMEHESTKESFDEAVASFARRVEKRAPDKKREMDAEMAAQAPASSGPGGLQPVEVLHSLPREMRDAFEAQDIQRLHAAVEALPADEAAYHLRRCEDSGLWVPDQEAGPAPYRDV